LRLTEWEKTVLTTTLHCFFGKDAIITLFGSRVDDTKKGGDIDILVEVDMPYEKMFRNKLRAISDIQLKMGDRKIDLVTFSPASAGIQLLPAIVAEAKNTGVRL